MSVAMGLEMGVHGDGSAGDARADASGLLRIMWATPLLTVPEVIGNDLRERVATAALALHAQWELQAAQQAAAEAEASHGRRQRATGGARSVRGEGGNDLFFRWQRSKFRALDSIGAEGWDAEADTVDAALDDVLAAEDLRALKQAGACRWHAARARATHRPPRANSRVGRGEDAGRAGPAGAGRSRCGNARRRRAVVRRARQRHRPLAARAQGEHAQWHDLPARAVSRLAQAPARCTHDARATFADA